jgi:hypothetical protein
VLRRVAGNLQLIQCRLDQSGGILNGTQPIVFGTPFGSIKGDGGRSSYKAEEPGTTSCLIDAEVPGDAPFLAFRTRLSEPASADRVKT